MKKNISITIIVFLLVVIMFNITGCSIYTINEPTQNTNTTENAEPIETTEAPNKYLSEITWALDTHYACAVELDEYDGDVIQAGTYRFYPEAVVLGTGKIPVVWDIYVSTNYYNKLDELQDDECKGSVGGVDKLELTLELEAGQYVYVKYHAVANNNPTGMLQITKIS